MFLSYAQRNRTFLEEYNMMEADNLKDKTEPSLEVVDFSSLKL